MCYAIQAKMSDPVLTAKLETLLLRELALEWAHQNRLFFKEAMRPPQMLLVASRATLGRYHSTTRTIEMSRPLLLEQPWGVVLEVLKHEMAHQYVHEVLGETREAAHGPAFRSVCQRLGIDAAAAGMPAASPEETRIVERIARLLALAESPNRHEAEAAAAAAQRLMLKHNLEVQKDATARGYGWKHLGVPKTRVTESERTLAMILGKHFFVDVIWVPVYMPREGKRGSVLEVCGRPTNIEIAEYVHAFMQETAARLWEEHKAAQKVRGNRDRRAFVAGVMAGFADKLAKNAAVQREAGLVWVKDAHLTGFLRTRHPQIRHVRYTGARRTEAFTHGRKAGQSIVLHRGVKAKGGGSGAPRLLPPARP